jgi:hypothetical protein
MRGARYCSSEHRLRALAYERVKSATATVRERETPMQSAAETALNALSRPSSSRSGTSRYTVGFALGLLLAIWVGIAGLPSRHLVAESGKAVENQVRRRAAIRLYDDFHGTFDAWNPVAAHPVRGDWRLESGFLRPGSLRLWSETAALTDYQLEFTGQIRERALNWVVRAKDAQNYVGCRLEVTRPGPLPLVDFVRFSRVDGTLSRPVRRPLPLTVRADTTYEVRMQVRGTDLVAMINGRIVEAWSETGNRTGGVGFWLDKGESASIRWVRVSERDDFTGKVLADILQPADQK